MENENNATVAQLCGGAVQCWKCKRWSVAPDGTRIFYDVEAPIPEGEKLAGRLAYWCPIDAP
jgi:hypothetical protein